MSNPWAIHGMIQNGHCTSAKQRGYLSHVLRENGIYGGGSGRIEGPPSYPTPVSGRAGASQIRRATFLKGRTISAPISNKSVLSMEQRYSELEARRDRLSSVGAKKVIEQQMRMLKKKMDAKTQGS